MILYLSIFLGGGLIGWALDTTYRTWRDKRFNQNTWIPFFSLIYGFNAVFLYILFTYFSTYFLLDIFFGLIISILVEMISGVIAQVFLKRRLWDYRSSRLNFYGLVDAKHSFYWLILVIICRLVYRFF